MAKVYDSILDLVGKTPLVELKRIEEKEGLQAKLIAKVESFNPAGSVKDRIAKAMIEDADQDNACCCQICSARYKICRRI